MGKCKTKTNQANLNIFMHIPAFLGIFRRNQTYSEIIRVYWGIFRTLCNPGMFRTLIFWEPEAYPEPWYIQNADTQYLEPEAYSEP